MDNKVAACYNELNSESQTKLAAIVIHIPMEIKIIRRSYKAKVKLRWEQDMKNNRKYKHLIVLVFLCMAVFGFIENLKGTLIPSIRSQFGVDYSAIGIMLLIPSCGYLLATLTGGLAADKLGKKAILMFGFIILTVAAALFYVANSFPVTVVLLLMVSIGFGYRSWG